MNHTWFFTPVLCVPGNATKAPCAPNFIYVSMRGVDTAQSNDTSTPPLQQEPECGSAKVWQNIS